MEQRIIQFVSALRAEGLAISLAETADAFRSLTHVGIEDREVFRIGMRSAIAKDLAAQDKFDSLFPLFFGRGTPPLFQNLQSQLSPEEIASLDELLNQLEHSLQDLLNQLLEGRKLDLDSLDQAAAQSGLAHADTRRQQEWLARRIENLLQFPSLRSLIEEITSLLTQHSSESRAQAVATGLARNLTAWQQQIREYVGGQIASNLAQSPRNIRPGNLTERSFASLSESDMQQLRHEVRRLATTLKSRIALRQKNSKSGAINLRQTIRVNQKYGGIPLQLKYRTRDRKPKIVVLCDISTSMRYCSELMLSLLFELSSLVRKTHAFAFIEQLSYISPIFTGRSVTEAIEIVLRNNPPGYYSTDLGRGLADLDRNYLDLLDSKTNLIILGDGRNNYNNPRLEIFQKLTRRAQRTIWVNPELPTQWGTGDSDFLAYRPFCTKIVTASNLKQLAEAIDHLLV